MLVFDREFEDTKGVIRIRKSKKDTQHNRQAKKDKRTINNLQNILIILNIQQHEPHSFFYNVCDLHLYCLIKRNINYKKTQDNSNSVHNNDIFNIYFSKFTEILLIIDTSIVIPIDL